MGYFEQNPLAFLAAVTAISFLSGWLGAEARVAVKRWLGENE